MAQQSYDADSVDFSDWDFAEEFTYSQTAALMAGVLPDLTDKRVKMPTPIHTRLADAAVKGLLAKQRNEPFPADAICDSGLLRKNAPGVLASVLDLALSVESRITRGEIVRWLGVTGLKSKYRFDRGAAQPVLSTEKLLSTRERDTLLTIIAALCKDAGYDYTKAAKTAGLIQSTAATMGVSIGETTIEGHLKKIPDALATRMK